jgi:hypothetical protein
LQIQDWLISSVFIIFLFAHNSVSRNLSNNKRYVCSKLLAQRKHWK